MLSYETLDTIADAYIPILLIVIALSLTTNFKHPHILLTLVCRLILLMLLPYGLMFADQALNIWGKYHSDYSTHTAVAATCCWYLFWLRKKSKLTVSIFYSHFIYWLWPLSLTAYLALMNYQNYHSWMDMLTTLVVLGPFLVMHRVAIR